MSDNYQGTNPNQYNQQYPNYPNGYQNQHQGLLPEM